MGTSPQTTTESLSTTTFSTMLVILLALALLSPSNAHIINIKLEIQNQDVRGWYQQNTEPVDICGYSKIVKCSDKLISAITVCSDHHSTSLTDCIEEVLGSDSECSDCIKTMCRKLHIKSCQ